MALLGPMEEEMTEPITPEKDKVPLPAPDLTTFSNAIYLSGREWIVVGLLSLVMVVIVPVLWEEVETFQPPPDYRLPYDLSNDYWLYARYARLAASRCDTLLVGDSVVWGQYVTAENTLSHYFNELAGTDGFANLGLDGAHPAALAGLMEYYGEGIKGKKVLLQCNPLWLSSSEHDLQEEDEGRLNHPQLVPQFFPRIPSYKEETSKRIGNVVAQHVPFSGWTSHLQQAYFDRMSIPAWTLENPDENPLVPLTRGLPSGDDVLRHEPISWTERGIAKQDFPWVRPKNSFQWRSFQRVVGILERRANRVFVLVGPFNEHMLQEPSRRAYQTVKEEIRTWLEAKRLAYALPDPLPSPDYADASHPLRAGYARLARQLFAHKFFREP
jgi:hypothetical protein